MSTEIVSTPTGRVVEVEAHAGNVYLAIHAGSTMLNANIDRPEFLAAVAAECDAIVIPRTDLPEVNARSERTVYIDGISYPPSTGAAEYRQIAIRALAMAEYLDAHPPVDEAQVEALHDAIIQAQSPGYPDAHELARRLLATGRIEVRP